MDRVGATEATWFCSAALSSTHSASSVAKMAVRPPFGYAESSPRRSPISANLFDRR